MSRSRNIYLTTIPLTDAVQRMKDRLERETFLGSETVPSHEAAGRVLKKAVTARYSSPAFHGAAMDGIAVKASDTFAAREGRPVLLEPGKGYEAVNTGNPLPEDRDAVVMIEDVVQGENGVASLEKPAFPWQHVRRIGEDIVATELLFPRNHRISAYDVGALLNAGIYDVEVYPRPHIWIIPTGDEILDFEDRPEPGSGQAVESNTQVLAAMARDLGLTVTRVPPVSDDPDLLAGAVQEALGAGVHGILICAGSSAGGKDFTRQVVESMGEVVVHGVSAMPGKPSLLGLIGNTIVGGVPGYPLSAVVCFEELLTPLFAWLMRREEPRRKTVPVILTQNAPSKLGVEEFLKVGVGRVGERYVAAPLKRGAANIGVMRRAQALIRVPANSEGLEAFSLLDAELLMERQVLDRVLMAVGSHDNTLDLLGDWLMGLEEPLRLSSSHVGSMGGLAAVKDEVAHMAGAHLFDPESQDYNFPFLQRHCPNADVTVVNLAIRQQGLIVAKGNPKTIQGVQDLARGDIGFVNRQRGAGTRILLDHHLVEAGISPGQVVGYGKEEYTHMAVAANVMTGAADCGLGIFAAAKALDLDFVPLARERYDLVIPTRFVNGFRVQQLLNLLQNQEFRDAVEELGGYETTLTGQRMQPGQGLDPA
ncbi:MAG: molybdopterin biosynthesis protein [Desulfovibrio sp.]|nr:MAG: molybdopterin biosynthesis protein [Desulfovibrio sp.]